jgi:glycosyltransferase involved in cell wall biosynthesis
MPPARATLVITTKNRKEELRAALASAQAQTEPLEIIVIDDGSTDGTCDMVRAEFPSARFFRSEVSEGLIAQRNRGAALASTNIIFSIDDDAIFVSRYTVAQTVKAFDHARVGAIAIPYIEPKKSPEIRQKAQGDGILATYDFIGTAHALRRDIFLSLGAYRAHLVHQGEEQDYCIRMLEAGYIVRLGDADPIHHMESPRRDFSRMDYYGAKNSVLFIYQNVPLPSAVLFLLVTTLKVLFFTLKPKRLRVRLSGVLAAYSECLLAKVQREPVSLATFVLFRRLKRSAGLPLSAITEMLAPIPEPAVGQDWTGGVHIGPHIL